MFVCMTVWEKISEKIRIALIFSLILVTVPFVTHASLSSSNYTLSNYTIGSTGGAMSSTQFSLTPSRGNIVTQTGGEETETTSRRGHGTTTRKNVTDAPNEQDVISEVYTERPSGVHIDAPRGTVFNTEDIEERNMEQKSIVQEDAPTDERASDNDEQKGKDKSSSRFMANLISGDLHNVLGSLKELFGNISKHFYARLGIFVGVIIVLWIVRTYTALGRRLSPF